MKLSDVLWLMLENVTSWEKEKKKEHGQKQTYLINRRQPKEFQKCNNKDVIKTYFNKDLVSKERTLTAAWCSSITGT